MREIDESDPSQEELIHTHLCEEAVRKLAIIEGEIQMLRTECETLYVQTGNERARFLTAELKRLESLNV